MPVSMFGSWVLNKIMWIIDLSSALVDILVSSSKLFLFLNEAHLKSGVRLLLELYCVIVIKHVAVFTIWVILTMVSTFTNLPLRWLNTVFDTCTSFTFFSKTFDLSVAKNGSKQVNNTNLGFLMVNLTYVSLPWQHE